MSIVDDAYSMLTEDKKKYPLPNDYCHRILEYLHQDIKGNRNESLQSINHDFLRYLNDRGYFLSIGNNYEKTPIVKNGHRTLERRLEIMIPCIDGCINDGVEDIDLKNIPFYSMIQLNFINVTTDASFSADGTPDPKDMTILLGKFLAMLRMAFGTEGSRYICSLSHDKELRDASTGYYDSLAEDGAFRILTQKSEENTIFSSNNLYSQKVLLESITDMRLHDLAEMYVKL